VSGVDFLTLDEKRALVGYDAVVVQDNSQGVASASSQLKFNPWHDESNGQFTFRGQGTNFGGGGATGSWDASNSVGRGGSFGGGGATGSWDNQQATTKIKPKRDGWAPPIQGTSISIHRPTTLVKPKPASKPAINTLASGSAHKPNPAKPSTLKPGGGSFGGGGASGSFDIPVPKNPQSSRPSQTPPKIRKPNIRKITLPPPDVLTTGIRRSQTKPVMRRITSNGYDFDVDASSRTHKAAGVLRLNPGQGRSKRAQRAAGEADRLSSDQGGHFIAREFDGPKARFNHFAQDAKFNKSEYRSLEVKWKGLIKRGHKVKVDIGARYEGQSQRPTRIDVTYYVDGEPSRTSFPNSSKGK
jgi:DNA/RNA non-specific endonuclease